MKLFKAITKVGKSQYVDWYKSETLDNVKLQWACDRVEFGLPEAANANVEFVECDMVTYQRIEVNNEQT